MRLFLYDAKHDQVNDDIDLESLSGSDIETLAKVFRFLRANGVLTRYHSVVVADSWKYVNSETGYSVVFDNVQYRVEQ